jgi:hypothetical protein
MVKPIIALKDMNIPALAAKETGTPYPMARQRFINNKLDDVR